MLLPKIILISVYIETGLEISSAATFTIATNTDTGTSRTWNVS